MQTYTLFHISRRPSIRNCAKKHCRLPVDSRKQGKSHKHRSMHDQNCRLGKSNSIIGNSRRWPAYAWIKIAHDHLSQLIEFWAQPYGKLECRRHIQCPQLRLNLFCEFFTFSIAIKKLFPFLLLLLRVSSFNNAKTQQFKCPSKEFNEWGKEETNKAIEVLKERREKFSFLTA